MNVYIDFDDCLCETARYFSELVKQMFDRDVPYEQIRYFELDKSFHLTDQQYEEMMIAAHRPEALISFRETAGASETVNRWIDEGHEISIITGRPFSAYAVSRSWLDAHGLARARLYCLNKYGRDSFIKKSDFNLELDDYRKMKFDFAIEDSPKAFPYFDHLPDVKVCVFDRPWNQSCALLKGRFFRCGSWAEIDALFRRTQAGSADFFPLA